MDAGSIAALIGSLKAIGDITKGMVHLRDEAAFQTKLIDLQREIVSAQTGALSTQMEQFTLIEKVRALEKRIDQFDTWEREKRRYQLTDFGSGTYAYVLTKDALGVEPQHYLCSNCFHAGQKAILQFQHRNYLGQDEYHCSRCKTAFKLGTPREPPQNFSRSMDDPWGS